MVSVAIMLFIAGSKPGNWVTARSRPLTSMTTTVPESASDFFTWSAIGAVLWVFGLVLAGYFLGAAFPVLGEQIDKAVIVIVVLSVLPMVYEWWKHRKEAKELGEIREEIVDIVKDELD